MIKLSFFWVVIFWANSVHALNITDIDEENKNFKIAVDVYQSKFFAEGENLRFSMEGGIEGAYCQGVIRDVDPGYFTLHVENINNCWSRSRLLRRGLNIRVPEEVFKEKSFKAGLTQLQIKERKGDYLQQLNEINFYLNNFDLEKEKIEAEYDRRIRTLKLEKIKALKDLYQKRKEKSEIQVYLRKELDRLKQSNLYYNSKDYSVDSTENPL
ncbi:MAG: hypothetical protein H6620_05725 [Halobacteriovoraceae bacterium]|nr:hypothetical protein [Halobacteriovoraceae bacterium]